MSRKAPWNTIAWLSTVSTSAINGVTKLKPMSRYRLPVSSDKSSGRRSNGKAAIPVIALNFKKLPESTDQARFSTCTTRKSPSVKGPASSDTSVMGRPRWFSLSGNRIRPLSRRHGLRFISPA
jgi:hypothetical protein